MGGQRAAWREIGAGGARGSAPANRVSPRSVTNGGKTTLTKRIAGALPNCCVVHQDDFFKVRRAPGPLPPLSEGPVGLGFLRGLPREQRTVREPRFVLKE